MHLIVIAYCSYMYMYRPLVQFIYSFLHWYTNKQTKQDTKHVNNDIHVTKHTSNVTILSNNCNNVHK